MVWNEETIEIPNLIEPKVDELLQEIYHGVPKETYTLETTGLEEAVASQVSEIASKWDKPAKNASISSFDKQSGKFVFTGEEAGQQVNQEALTAQIEAAIASKDFDAQITAEMTSVAPEITEGTAREKYKTISTYTTKTTSNSKRNTNVRPVSYTHLDVYKRQEEELMRDHAGIPHGGFVFRSGKTGWNGEHSHLIEYSLKLDSNPEFTASVIAAYALSLIHILTGKSKNKEVHRELPDGARQIQICFELAPE